MDTRIEKWEFVDSSGIWVARIMAYDFVVEAKPFAEYNRMLTWLRTKRPCEGFRVEIIRYYISPEAVELILS